MVRPRKFPMELLSMPSPETALNNISAVIITGRIFRYRKIIHRTVWKAPPGFEVLQPISAQTGHGNY